MQTYRNLNITMEAATIQKNGNRKMRWAGLLIGLACMMSSSMMGQEKMTAIQIAEERIFPGNEIELRAGDDYYWPDSIVAYESTGEVYSKTEYNKDNKTVSYYDWENGHWKLSGTYDSKGYSIWPAEVSFYEKSMFFQYNLVPGRVGWDYKDEAGCNAKYDSKGNVILIEIKDKNQLNWTTWQIKYNNNNDPVLIEKYYYDRLTQKVIYGYNEKNYMVQTERSYLLATGEWQIIKDVLEFDKQGRPAAIKSMEYNATLNNWISKPYSCIIFYYSDGRTPNLETGNNNPVGSENKGGLDVTVNIPIDSIAGGSFVIKLPDGFTLDTENTKLTVDFGSFDLLIVRQENNSWLLELKPKTTRSAVLLSDATTPKTLLHLAYTVDDKVKQGVYDIVLSSILFGTPGGDAIVEPAITVPVKLNRWGVSNERFEANVSNAYVADNTLYIQTAQSETVTVYTVTGIKLYESAVSSGITAINASAFPQGVLIVKGSSGWVRKVVM